MHEDPGPDVERISACLEAHYDLHVASVAFLPIGYDPNAAVYQVVSRDGTAHFLKVGFGPVHEPSLLVPRALIDLGVKNVLAPGERARAEGAELAISFFAPGGMLESVETVPARRLPTTPA